MTAAKRILVGFADGEASRDALALALRLAQAESAELILATVLSYAPLPIEVEGYEQEIDEHFERLADAAAQQLGDRGFEHLRVNEPSPARALARLAAEHDAELVVVGSTHRGPIGRILPGTVAERLFHGAPCAVAIAPRGYARHPHAGLGIAGVAYDGSPEAEVALAYAARLCAGLGWDLRVITVVAPIAAPVPLAVQTAEIQSAIREEWQRVLDRGIASVASTVSPRGLLADGDPALVLAGQGLDADLLVVGSRGYGPIRRALLGGVSGELTRLAPCPVIVTPRGSEPAPDEG